MQKWIHCGLMVICLVACGQLPQSFQNDENQNPKPMAYKMTIAGQEVVWAYAAESGPLNGPIMAEGLLLENLTPDKRLDDESARLTLLRAVNGTVNRGNELITFLDAHPDDASIALNYQLNESEPVTVTHLREDRYKVYMNLYKAPPSYRNAQGVGSTQIPVGTVTVTPGRSRAYVSPDQNVQLASISQGASTGSWGLRMFNQINSGTATQPTRSSEWCETTTVQAGTLMNQSVSNYSFNCRPRPSEFDLCENAQTGIDGCIGKAPVEDANPFSNVGSLDITYLKNYNGDQRVFTLNPQAPFEVKIEATFVAKNLLASAQDNADKCRDHFRAVGWTIGARVNEHCVLTPDPSPQPVDGHLACKVVLQFVQDRTYQDKNCYVSGIFNGEEEQMEQFLIYRE